MKTIAVIGPDQRHAQTVATQLMRCRAIVGAGPQDNPDGVIAVVGEHTQRDQEVVDAVSQAMGAVILYRPRATEASWPEQPGVYHCTTVAEVQEAVDALVLNRQRWAADARRADLERADRVRIAVRVEMNRVASNLIKERAAQDPEAAHEQFVQSLRAAVLRQGVSWPSVEMEAPGTDVEKATGNRIGELSALAAGLLGGLAIGFALGRMLGQPLWGLVIGLLVAVVGAGVRLVMVRSAQREADAARRGTALREAWMGMVADVMSRVQIPRVADAVAGGR